MPQLTELVDGVYRDLADEAKEVFSTLQVEDFIRGGIAELNRVAPQDTEEVIEFVTDPENGVINQNAYATSIELPYRVEWFRLSDGWSSVLAEPEVGQSGASGYTFKRTANGGTITFPAWWITQVNPLEYGIRLHGYAPRPLPYTTDPDPINSPSVPLSSEEEYSVRSYAKSEGFDLLAHDRSLFAQWQGQSNNTDVSPTQMMQMSSNAKQEWDRQRGLIRVVRRYW